MVPIEKIVGPSYKSTISFICAYKENGKKFQGKRQTRDHCKKRDCECSKSWAAHKENKKEVKNIIKIKRQGCPYKNFWDNNFPANIVAVPDSFNKVIKINKVIKKKKPQDLYDVVNDTTKKEVTELVKYIVCELVDNKEAVEVQIKEESEKVVYKKGDNDWSDFWEWFNGEECNECPLCEWLNELAEEMREEVEQND